MGYLVVPSELKRLRRRPLEDLPFPLRHLKQLCKQRPPLWCLMSPSRPLIVVTKEFMVQVQWAMWWSKGKILLRRFLTNWKW